MRTTIELLKLLESDMFALYEFTYKEKVSIRGLTYKIVNGGHISYFMTIRLIRYSAYLMYNKEFNMISLTYVNECDNPWINLTIYSKGNNLFRSILHGEYDIDSIDKMWLKVYRYFKGCTITKAMFIYFCNNQLKISDFEWE